MRRTRQFFDIGQRGALFFGKSRGVSSLERRPVLSLQPHPLGRGDVVLRAVMASVNQRDAQINQFIELAVQRAPNACIKRQEILQHLRTMRQRLLRIAWFAAKSLLVDFLHLGIRRFQAD